MPLTQEDIQAIQDVLAPVIGREAWGVHVGYGATIGIKFGTVQPEIHRRWSRTRGEWMLWTDSGVWLFEDDNGVLTANEDPDPVVMQAAQRLNGRRLLSVDISPTNASTVFTFDGGLILRLFPRYMDPNAGQTHWILFAPGDNNLAVGPGTTWPYRSDKPVASFTTDSIIDRFVSLCEDAWPRSIDAFELQRIHVDREDRFDLRLRVHPQDRDDERLIALSFYGVQHLSVAQTNVGTGIDYLRIEPVGDRGWDGISYDVHNPGQDILTFYCASFDVSVERT